MNHTSFYGKCEELASNRALCRQSADDGKNITTKKTLALPSPHTGGGEGQTWAQIYVLYYKVLRN